MDAMDTNTMTIVRRGRVVGVRKCKTCDGEYRKCGHNDLTWNDGLETPVYRYLGPTNPVCPGAPKKQRTHRDAQIPTDTCRKLF